MVFDFHARCAAFLMNKNRFSTVRSTAICKSQNKYKIDFGDLCTIDLPTIIPGFSNFDLSTKNHSDSSSSLYMYIASLYCLSAAA